jgi:hypothetical protein
LVLVTAFRILCMAGFGLFIPVAVLVHHLTPVTVRRAQSPGRSRKV